MSHLFKSYDRRPVVQDLSFSVEAGEVFGLLGPNGAGKSTTMMMVAGLRRPDSGSVTIAGQTLARGGDQVKRLMGVVPQELALYPDLTARENLQFFGSIYGVPRSDLEPRIEQVLELIGLTTHAHGFVETFSGGMKRRLNFGAALLHQPRLVILDEPTVGVDPQSRAHLLDCVRRLATEGVAVIYASHYMEEVEAICQRVAIVEGGRMLACGGLEELLDRSRSDLYLRVQSPASFWQGKLDDLARVEPLSDAQSQLVVHRGRQESPATINARLVRLLQALEGAGVEILAIETKEHNLERLFLELTGKTLRD
ncbi:MAG: ABC transporter ATP-binding protein [Planctomycetales bacterium]